MEAEVTVTYQDWNLSYGKAHRRPPYDQAEARRRFEAGEGLWVLFGEPDRPEVVMNIELGGNLVKVVWLDALNRPELSYLFVHPDDWPNGSLFLEQTGILEHDHDELLPDAEPNFAEAWYFSPDGTYHAARQTREGTAEQADGHLEPDQIGTHREPKPVFGEWDSITRRDR